ncbi:ABC transporter substrate-binding protein [Mycobacterium sp. GA-2829]|uniref:ABC transporter substrate-binding protein n=1 Tax=Mycobacterium sp. GA-2829 TaxID=1772283 RepID=UPI00073FF4C9|nr:ABC transporter substrate-binding protein [Mycobacterium sp. GA-2829]KUI26872.1 substrate-binding protein, ABC transporter [Mycobacterium sp. GA-2829]
MIWSPKAFAALFAAGALLFGATACADESAEPAAQGTDELSISATGVDSLPFMAILQAGINKGWFEEEGLKVDLFSGGGGGNTLRVVTSGDADMAIAGNTSVLLAARQPDSNLKVIAPWFQVNDFSWISPPGRTLEGATLGFSSAGSSTELIVKALEKKLGVKSQAVGPMGDNWTAAKAGQITAGWAMQPFIADKEATDNAQVLVNSREVIGDMPADLVAVNADYAEANAENLKAFFRVADRLNKWVVENPEEAGAELGPLVKVSPQVMTAALRNTPDIEKGYSLTVDPDGLKNLSELMVAAGQIPEPVDWATVLDQQYLPDDARTEF